MNKCHFRNNTVLKAWVFPASLSPTTCCNTPPRASFITDPAHNHTKQSLFRAHCVSCSYYANYAVSLGSVHYNVPCKAAGERLHGLVGSDLIVSCVTAAHGTNLAAHHVLNPAGCQASSYDRNLNSMRQHSSPPISSWWMSVDSTDALFDQHL